MGQLLLVSVLIATVVIPMYTARDPFPARGLRRMVLWVAVFHLVYVFSLMHVYPRLP